jgi:hypothetical protein
MSQHYNASIGKSTYEIPYESQDDLPLLKTICANVNRLINTIISENQLISNEFALVLALLNIVYETGFSMENTNVESAKNDNSQGVKYTSQDVLEILEYIKKNIKI